MLRGELGVFRSWTRAREFAAQQFAGPEEARFDGALRKMEGAGCRRDILLMKVKEEDGVAVSGGQGKHCAAEGLVAGGLVVSSTGKAGIGRLGDLVERQHSGRDTA